jgi:hypothetical protein
MSFSAPKPPDPTQTSNTQQQYNTAAAKTQNQNNSYNQSNAFGSTAYMADPNSPSGYSVNTSLNPQSQAILDTQRGTIGNLANASAGMYSSPYDLNAASAATAKTLNGWQQQYLQPIFDQQSSNTEAQLRNQGLAPGTEAYNNAKNLLARNQGDITNQYLTNNQGQAFSQALQAYQTPLQTIAGLEQTLPGNPTFQQTPTAQIQPANYQGAAQNAYQGQVDNYNTSWNNIGKLGTAAAGLVAAPFTGGASLLGAGALSGMFGGSGITGYDSYGGTTFPKVGGGWG